MIDFRYHVISIVAIFLALATGVALGAGPLKGGIDQQLVNAAQQDRQDKLDLRSQLDRANTTANFQDEFTKSVASQLLGSRLNGRSVALFTLPGADRSITSGVSGAVKAAGGTVTGTVSLQPALLDPQNRQVAEGLARQVLAGVNGVPSTNGASSYQLVGYSLARAYLSTQPQGAPVDGPAQTIAASLVEAKYVSVDSDIGRRAGLAVVVAAPPDPSEPGQTDLVTTLVQAMDAASGGVVLAGGVQTAASGGFVKAVRDGEAARTVSTVDVADTEAGQVVVVLALAEQAAGKAGQYGDVGSSDGAMPSGAAP